jgi:hypothetical protein
MTLGQLAGIAPRSFCIPFRAELISAMVYYRANACSTSKWGISDENSDGRGVPRGISRRMWVGWFQRNNVTMQDGQWEYEVVPKDGAIFIDVNLSGTKWSSERNKCPDF